MIIYVNDVLLDNHLKHLIIKLIIIKVIPINLLLYH